MAEPWRFHRPTPNLCPFCSSPHFPFCPPPPPDPFYAPFRPPPPPPMFNHPSNDFLEPHGPPNFKRSRLNDQIPLFEDDRRIGLIRDHGGPVGFTPPPMARPWDNNQFDGGHNRDFPRSVPGDWNGARVSERSFTNLLEDYRGGSFRGNAGFGGNSVGGYRDGDSDRRLDFYAGQFSEERERERAGLYPGSNYGHERYGYNGQGQIGQPRDVVIGQYLEPTSFRPSGNMHAAYSQPVESNYELPAHRPSGNMHTAYSQPVENNYELPARRPSGNMHTAYSQPVENNYELPAHHPSGDMHTAYSQPFENNYELPEKQHQHQHQHHGVKRNYSEVMPYAARPSPFETEVNRTGDFGEGSYASLPGGRSSNGIARGMEDRIYGSEFYHPQLSVNVPEGHPEAPQQPRIQVANSSPLAPKTWFPVLPSSSCAASFPPSAHEVPVPDVLQQSNCYSVPPVYSSAEVGPEGLLLSLHAPPKLYHEERSQKVAIDRPLQNMATIIDAKSLFKPPHRTSRPDHIVIILRGLPGSGKSYLAKALRDLEVENGGNAPRIHAMDDYFMVEVEKKVEENDGSRSSSSSRVKRQMTKKVIEYCYEPDMEEAYRSSMLKAFTKTIDEGIFTFIIVDDRNLRVADFAQFWAIAKRSGYEVYLLEAPYNDPTGCAARNVHGFTLDDVQKMSEQWEEAPVMYLRLDTQSLFRGDNLNEDSIQEVDMDTGDDELPSFQDKEGTRQDESIAVNYKPDQVRERWDSEGEEEEKENDTSKVKDLGSSKWSKDFDEEIENKESNKQNVNALSGLIQSYSKKSVHWCDQAGKNGFSIGAAKKLTGSLIIGPGSGYNFMSNPVIDDKDEGSEAGGNSYIKKKFNDQLRAESESFRAVFDKRRHRIGGFNNAEDD